jgi:hypothetical protein
MQCTRRPTGPTVVSTSQGFIAIMLVLLTVGNWMARDIMFVFSFRKMCPSANFLKSYYEESDTQTDI